MFGRPNLLAGVTAWRRNLVLAVLISMLVIFFNLAKFTPKNPPTSSEMLRFPQTYSSICEQRTPTVKQDTLPWCPCLPNSLIGGYLASAFLSNLLPSSQPVAEETDRMDYKTLLKPLPVLKGGHWHPQHCKSRQSVAIIIPFRNRHQHLQIFEKYMNSFLQRQLLDYSIFVIEQGSPEIFNRAALMNVGFIEARKHRPDGYDCYIFHDVDLLPENDHNMYTCFMAPLHLGAFMNKFDYKMPYGGFFGGALALDGKSIIAMNGFSNHYYGWGGEDDDTRKRVEWLNLTIQRYPADIGRSYMIKHKQDKDNPDNPERYDFESMDSTAYLRDGISSIQYKTNRVEENEMHTKITISLDLDGYHLFNASTLILISGSLAMGAVSFPKPSGQLILGSITGVTAFNNKEYRKECIVDDQLPATAPNNYVECMTKELFIQGTIGCCREHSRVYCCNKELARFRKLATWIFVFSSPLIVIIVYVTWLRRKSIQSYCGLYVSCLSSRLKSSILTIYQRLTS